MARLEAAGLRCTRLPVATAFHSPVVSAAGDELSAYLTAEALQKPQIPVYRNTTAKPHGTNLAAALGEHLRSPVRWVEQIEAMYAAGARVFVEVGPGSVLSGLVGRILKDKPHVAVALEAKGKDGLEGLQAALGRLVAAGVPLNLVPLAEGRAPGPNRFVAKPGSILINGANYGKPYPRPDSKPVPPNAEGKHPAPATLPGAAAAPAPVATASVVAAPRAATAAQAPNAAPLATASLPPAPSHAPARPAPVSAPPSAKPESRVSNPTNAAHGWIAAFQENQRQLAEVHERFGRSMADTHMAFLRAQEVATGGLVAMVTGHAPAMAAPAYSPAPAPTYAQPVYAQPAPISAPPAYAAPPAPAPAYVAQPVPATASVYAPPPLAHAAPVATPKPTAPVAAPRAGAAPSRDLPAMLLSVVAEKTGYPAEMLRLDMNLEADLGIDSIKRVEILSALREQAPELPEPDAETLGKLHTLGQIVEVLNP